MSPSTASLERPILERCPVTYEPLLPGERFYSRAGLRRLARGLGRLAPLAFTPGQLVQEAAARADRMSIGGVQPKVSAVLRASAGEFEVVTAGGRWILKPDNPAYPHLPASEDLVMRLNAAAGVRVADHALVWSRSEEDAARPGALVYATRRFDRVGRSGKLAVEDFAQLLGLPRSAKYDASMERAAGVVDRFSTFPAVEKVELFRRVLVAFLCGDEDLHLKNLSVVTEADGLRRLSPAYDCVATTIVLRRPKQLALTLAGKRDRLTRSDLVEYFAQERLGLRPAVANRVIREVEEALPRWRELIARSFLPSELQERLRALVAQRCAVMGIGGGRQWRGSF